MDSGHGASQSMSVLLPFLKYNGLQHIIEWLAISIFGAMVTSMISWSFLYFVVHQITTNKKSDTAAAKVKKYMPLFKRAVARHTELNSQLASINSRHFIKTRSYEKAIRIRDQLEKRKDIQVRFANMPNRDLQCFSAYVYNEFVRKYVSKGQRYPLLDDDWATPQLVEVWAETIEKAELEIARKYSKMFGFVTNNLEKIKPLPTVEQLRSETSE